MITEDKVIDFFCIADDFAIFLMHRWQNIRLRQKESANTTVKAVSKRRKSW